MKSLVVLRNNLERRRRKLLWPGKEEGVDVTPQLISDIKQTRHNTDTQPDLRTPLTATSGWVLKYSKYILVYNLLTTSTTILETNSRYSCLLSTNDLEYGVLEYQCDSRVHQVQGSRSMTTLESS